MRTTADDTIRLALGSEADSLEIHKKPDGHTDDRLRYFRLVAVRGKRESPQTIEVPVRPDTAGDQILYSGDPPDDSFKGTPVTGYWTLRTLLTSKDKADPGQIPKGLSIFILVKHR